MHVQHHWSCCEVIFVVEIDLNILNVTLYNCKKRTNIVTLLSKYRLYRTIQTNATRAGLTPMCRRVTNRQPWPHWAILIPQTPPRPFKTFPTPPTPFSDSSNLTMSGEWMSTITPPWEKGLSHLRFTQHCRLEQI
jgi:hypothetical protein